MSRFIEKINQAAENRVDKMRAKIDTALNYIEEARAVDGRPIKVTDPESGHLPLLFQSVPVIRMREGQKGQFMGHIPLLVIASPARREAELSVKGINITKKRLKLRIGQRDLDRPYLWESGLLKLLFPYDEKKEVSVSLSKKREGEQLGLGLKLERDGISFFGLTINNDFRELFQPDGRLRSIETERKKIEVVQNQILSRIIKLEDYYNTRDVEKLRALFDRKPREVFFALWNTAKFYRGRNEFYPPEEEMQTAEKELLIRSLSIDIYDSGLSASIDSYTVVPVGHMMMVTIGPINVPEGADDDLDVLIKPKSDDEYPSRLNLRLEQKGRLLAASTWYAKLNPAGQFQTIQASADIFSKPDKLCRLIAMLILPLERNLDPDYIIKKKTWRS